MQATNSNLTRWLMRGKSFASHDDLSCAGWQSGRRKSGMWRPGKSQTVTEMIRVSNSQQRTEIDPKALNTARLPDAYRIP